MDSIENWVFGIDKRLWFLGDIALLRKSGFSPRDRFPPVWKRKSNYE